MEDGGSPDVCRRQLSQASVASSEGSTRPTTSPSAAQRVREADWADSQSFAGHSAGGAAQSVQLFVFVHGICGAASDWDLWKQRLALCGRSDFRVRTSSSITRGAWFAGQELRRLGALLADEVQGWVRDLLEEGSAVKLHFIGHSLGGLIMRAALPQLCDGLEGEAGVSYGQFLTLNTPHLGVYGANLFMGWKNLSILFPAWLFKQIHQLTLQDGSDTKPERAIARPRLLDELANPKGKSCCCLARFEQRTAVAATHWDVIVPFCTAAICSTNPFPAPSLLAGDFRSFWRVDAATGFKDGTRLSSFKAGPCCSSERAAECRRSWRCHQQEPRQPRSNGWLSSSDGEVAFPAPMLDGLAGLEWRRVAYTLHQPWWGHGDVHLFTIGKDRKVLKWSIEFIDLLISMFVDDKA